MRHNDVKYALIDLAKKALCPSAVRDEPLINPCRPASEQVSSTQDGRPTAASDKDLRGDILIKNLWARQQDTILDIAVIDTDAKTHSTQDPLKVLERVAKQKKAKYLKACFDQRRTFVPFVVSVDGLISKEAQTQLQRLSAILAEKWERPYSVVCSYVRAQMSFAILRATHRCIRGSRIPAAQISTPLPLWEDQAGLGLYRF